MRADRWEAGSDYHALDLGWSGGSAPFWAARRHALYGTGRDVVLSVVEGRRLWVPSYFCQDVVRSWQGAGVEVSLYADSPLDDPAEVDVPAAPGDAALTVAFFGLRAAPRVASDDVLVIEDHTHDPLSDAARSSDADVVFASLRKTLPVPDGAAVWTRERPLPDLPLPDGARAAAVLARLTAMQLKARYLRGEAVDKARFRACAIAGEEGLARSAPTTASSYTTALLEAFGHDAWRACREANWSHLAAALEAGGVTVLRPRGEGFAPFSVLACFEDRASRDRARAALIEARVYPAILWTLDEPALPGARAADVSLAETHLSIHCDGRYDVSDMARVGDALLGGLRA